MKQPRLSATPVESRNGGKRGQANARQEYARTRSSAPGTVLDTRILGLTSLASRIVAQQQGGRGTLAMTKAERYRQHAAQAGQQGQAARF
jgi:hypothetical protein